MIRSITIMALALGMAVVAGTAGADSVDVGLGCMDRAEFERLRQMVGGEFRPATSPAVQPSRQARVAEFERSIVEGIRQAMAGGPRGSEPALAATGGRVDIGTGSMATSDFCDLNRLVASSAAGRNTGFSYLCP